MKVTNPKIIALFVGVVVLATVVLYLARFLTDHPEKNDIHKLFADGKTLFDSQKYGKAIPKLEESLRKATEGGRKEQADQSLLFLARCYTAEGDSEKAMQSWQSVVDNPALENHHAQAFYTLGEIRAADQNAESQPQAEEYYARAVEAGAGSRFGELAEIGMARMMIARGETGKAEEILDKLQGKEEEYPELKKARYQLNIKLLFSPFVTEVPRSEYYIIKEGDTLDSISRKFNTTVGLLERSNAVDPARLQVGKKLKVVTGNFQLKVSRSKNTLQLLSQDVVLNEYNIGTGKHGSTPAGRFKISEKIVNPPWFRDGRVIPYGHPENVLGTRWMGLEPVEEEITQKAEGIGIHGTDDQSSIGRQSSEGCIRLIKRDVEELYSIVPLGTEVIIEE